MALWGLDKEEPRCEITIKTLPTFQDLEGVSSLQHSMIWGADSNTSRLVSEWVGTPGFILFCDISGWDDGWVQDVFKRMDDIPTAARGAVSSQCVRAMGDLTPDHQGGE